MCLCSVPDARQEETSISEIVLLPSYLIQLMCGDLWFRVGYPFFSAGLNLILQCKRDQRANHSTMTTTHKFISAITLQMVRVKDLLCYTILYTHYIAVIQMSFPQASLSSTNITNDLSMNVSLAEINATSNLPVNGTCCNDTVEYDAMDHFVKFIPIAVQYTKVNSVCLLNRETEEGRKMFMNNYCIM